MRFKALTYDLSTQRLDVKLGWLPLGGKDVVSLNSWCRSRAWRGGWAELSSSRWAGLGGDGWAGAACCSSPLGDAATGCGAGVGGQWDTVTPTEIRVHPGWPSYNKEASRWGFESAQCFVTMSNILLR